MPLVAVMLENESSFSKVARACWYDQDKDYSGNWQVYSLSEADWHRGGDVVLTSHTPLRPKNWSPNND